MNIEIVNIDDLNLDKSFPTCEIHAISVVFDGQEDVCQYITQLGSKISNTSWLNNLKPIYKKTFEPLVNASIQRIVGEIFTGVINGLNTNIGEYLISECAQDCLVDKFQHTQLPLAELLKEKIIGNPGFDFHTISANSKLIQGEAKFSLKSTRYDEALNQIADFIQSAKHNGDFATLIPLLDEITIQNLYEDKRGYCAAFSTSAKSPVEIIKHALNHSALGTICVCDEFYLISIKIC